METNPPYDLKNETEELVSKYSPKIIFIIPYRDREAYMRVFMNHMPYILREYDENSYEIYFAHQYDDRPFNRGAMKNIGFLYAKQRYPDTYKNITFVFHDIDTLPGTVGMWTYGTTIGVAKHFYGFSFALGGIVSMTGNDFELINGYPNFWGWGYEDNMLYDRCIKHDIKINRDEFRVFKSKEVVQTSPEITRKIDYSIKNKYIQITKGNIFNNGIDSISLGKIDREKLENNYYMLHCTGWEIPESHENFNVIDAMPNTLRKRRRLVNMSDIMR